MKNSQLTTRRVFITLSGTALATISGCLGFLGIGSNSEAGSNSESGSDGGTTDESTTSDDLPEQEPNSSENTTAPENEPNDTDTEAVANESTEAGNEENEAAVPESNPQNDPSQTEPADPNTTEPPTSDDIELVESSFSTNTNKATITVRNTADERVNSIDLWVVFYTDSGQQVDEGMNGATGVDPDQTVTITVPSEASDATTFEIQRVMVST
ncbi:FxLYD domain-containing protein [Halalkalicoccus ordinarius]|uniref:FxLYD domain-containing protein n=1 Tax=Halalkalicoccus ordinarius TaxID=3116651 RepID=UPI00300F2DDF